MQWLEMSGRISSKVTQLTQLRVLNLAYNLISSTIPSSEDWVRMQKLQVIEIQNNSISGYMPE